MKGKAHIPPPSSPWVTVTPWGWIHRWPTQRRHLGVQKVVAMMLSGNRVAVMVWCVWPRPCSRVCGVILANDPESTSISLLSAEYYPKAIKQDYWSSLSLFPSSTPLRASPPVDSSSLSVCHDYSMTIPSSVPHLSQHIGPTIRVTVINPKFLDTII